MLEIVFENANFVAVDKPAGWLTTPGREGASDPRPCLIAELRKTREIVLPVHRLDLEVSGLVLVARTAEAHRSANGWFEGRSIQKTYEAWTEGAAPAEAAAVLWESKLVRGKRRAFEADHGKPSKTRASWVKTLRLETGGEAQVWRLEPLTGRAHQLRYELAKHGFPVLGDALYGATVGWRPGAIALRAVSLDVSESAEAVGYGLPARLEVKGL